MSYFCANITLTLAIPLTTVSSVKRVHFRRIIATIFCSFCRWHHSAAVCYPHVLSACIFLSPLHELSPFRKCLQGGQ